MEERINAALDMANRYGGIDGDHHRTWVIDQMVRLLCGSPEAYAEWVRLHNDGEDGPNTYEWQVGLPP